MYGYSKEVVNIASITFLLGNAVVMSCYSNMAHGIFWLLKYKKNKLLRKHKEKTVQKIIISIELEIIKLISVNDVKHNNYRKRYFYLKVYT